MLASERFRRSLLTEEYEAVGLASPVEGHLRLHRKADECREPVIDLSIMTDQTPPPEVRVAAAQQALKGGYIKNSLPVRQTIARFYESERDVRTDPREEIFVTAGSQLALDSALKLLIEPGDEVLVGEPEYATYEPMVHFYGGRTRSVPLARGGDGWSFDVDGFGRAISGDTKLVVLSNPNNPVGYVYRRNELREIARLAKKHDAWVISDEIWSTLVLDERLSMTSMGIFEEIRDRLIILFSASKTFGMSGYRTGAMIAPRDFIRAIDQVVRFTVQAAPTIGQVALATALDPAATGSWLQTRKETLRRRVRDVLAQMSEVDGLECASPESGVFLFPDISSCGSSSLDFAMDLIERKNVYVLPGYFYGRHCDQFVRVSLSVSEPDLRNGISRLLDFVREHA